MVGETSSEGILLAARACCVRSVLPERGSVDVRVLGPDAAVLLSADVVAVGRRPNGEPRSPVEFDDERLRLIAVHRHAPVVHVHRPVPTVASCHHTTQQLGNGSDERPRPKSRPGFKTASKAVVPCSNKITCFILT